MAGTSPEARADSAVSQFITVLPETRIVETIDPQSVLNLIPGSKHACIGLPDIGIGAVLTPVAFILPVVIPP